MRKLCHPGVAVGPCLLEGIVRKPEALDFFEIPALSHNVDFSSYSVKTRISTHFFETYAYPARWGGVVGPDFVPDGFVQTPEISGLNGVE